MEEADTDLGNTQSTGLGNTQSGAALMLFIQKRAKLLPHKTIFE